MVAISLSSKAKLKTGYEIPLLGFGTAGSPSEGYKTEPHVSVIANVAALAAGYRHFDSARYYRSEGSCGKAISQAGNRSEVFVTSKAHKTGYSAVRKSIDMGLQESGLGYFDLYLIHTPYGGPEARKGAWRALVEAKAQGKVRSIGVSNYGIHHLEETEAYISELEVEFGRGNGGEISVGQWELHPWLMRPDIVDWCRKRDIIIQAYCPLVRQHRSTEPVLQELANKYNKDQSQILIRWSLQKGFIPLPKSATPSRIESNAAVYDFELSECDVASLDSQEYAPCGWDPTTSPLDNK